MTTRNRIANSTQRPTATTFSRGRIPWLIGAVLLSVLMTFVAPATLFAQPLRPEEPVAEEQVEGNFTLSLGFGKLAEDYFLRSVIGGTILIHDVQLANEGSWFEETQDHDLRIGLYAPFNFLLFDGSPNDETTFRTQDWDEISEFLRIARVVEYGRPYDGIYWRAGELTNVRIGHRTIVDNYINTVDVDHFQWGLHTNINTLRGGIEAMIDNVVAPGLVGGRVYIRPWEISNPDLVWRRFAFGVTAMADVGAPSQLGIEVDGTYQVRDDALVVEDADVTGIVGIDAEFQAVQSERLRLTPYVDGNLHLGHGGGMHTGTFFGYQASDALVIDGRLEYQLLGSNYLPNYFGLLYEAQRFAFLPVPGTNTQSVPKLQWLSVGSADLRHGVAGEIGFNFQNRLIVSLGYEDATGPDNSTLWMRLVIPASDIFQLGLFYAHAYFDGGSELSHIGDGLLVTEARVQVSPWFFVVGQFSRRWQVSRFGTYDPVDDFGLAIGGAVAF